MVKVYLNSNFNNIFVTAVLNYQLLYKNSLKAIKKKIRDQKRSVIFAYHLGFLTSCFLKKTAPTFSCFIFFKWLKKEVLYFYKGFKKQNVSVLAFFFSKKKSFNGCKIKKKRRL